MECADNAKISVIMSVYNAGKYLRKSLDSIFSQDFKQYELILIDNGSTDSSAKIISSYSDDPRVRIKSLEHNTGDPSEPWNIGIDMSHGKYIAFVDSDDWCSPQLLSKLYSFAEKHRSDIVTCNCYEVLPDGNVNIWDHGSGNQLDMILEPSLPVWGKLYRRDTINRYGLRFYPHIHCDAEFNMIAYTYCNRIDHLPEPLYYYNRDNLCSETNSLKKPRQAEVVDTFKNVIAKSNPRFSEEIMYSTAVQIYRFLMIRHSFFADKMLEFLNEFQNKLISNRYFSKNYNNMGFVVGLATRVPLPKIIWTTGEFIGSPWLDKYDVKKVSSDDTVTAYAEKNGDNSLLLTYSALNSLYENGGILIAGKAEVIAPLGELRAYDFCAAKKERGISSRILAAARHEPIIKELMNRYLEKHSKPKKSSFYYAANELDALLEDILNQKFHIIYDLSDQTDGHILLLSSARAIYGFGAKALIKTDETLPDGYIDKAIDAIAELTSAKQALESNVYRYQNSTSWKITQPLRAAADIIKKRKG